MRTNQAYQPELFEPEVLYDVQTVRQIDGYDVLAQYGDEGSYVDVKERAEKLLVALVSLSGRNQRDGLSVATYTDEYSGPIWERYRWGTEAVVDGAGKNRDIYHHQLRRSFWEATGFTALRGSRIVKSGILPERQINPRAKKMWRDFNHAFGHPKKVGERNRYMRVLSKQINDSKKVKEVKTEAASRKYYEEEKQV
jgi:hypothetical protein